MATLVEALDSSATESAELEFDANGKHVKIMVRLVKGPRGIKTPYMQVTHDGKPVGGNSPMPGETDIVAYVASYGQPDTDWRSL